MNAPKYPVDLHTHSTRSDGNDTVQELIDSAAALGLRAVALTDHDTRPPAKIELSDGSVVSPTAYALSKKLIFIPGIEFSCDTNVDDVHIVGLGCDFSSPLFLKAERDAGISKTESYRRLTELLCEHGIQVSWDDVLRGADPPRKPAEVQRKHIFEAMALKGYAASWAEAKLLVRDDPVFNVRREKIAPNEAVRIIHATGGIAILAHPYLIDERVAGDDGPMTRCEYIEKLITDGLDGIEASYPYDKTSYKGRQTRFEVQREVTKKYGGRLAVISGGSDYHNDGKKGAADPRTLGECGVPWEYFTKNALLKRFARLSSPGLTV